jgi:hypothetical protein
MDILLLSKFLKSQMVQAIPICMKALKLRGLTNPPMVADIVKTFYELSFDSACKKQLLLHGEELLEFLKASVMPPLNEDSNQLNNKAFTYVKATNRGYHYDIETFAASENLRACLLGYSLSMSPIAANPQKIKRSSSSNDSSKEKAASHTVFSIDKTPVTGDFSKHVLLSYVWSSTDLVKKFDEVLQANKINVWVDYRCMGTSIDKSIEDAITNAYIMICFISTKYQQSGLCRREHEALCKRNIPVLYLVAEKDYEPGDWLGFVIQRTPVLGIFDSHDLATLQANLPEILKHISDQTRLQYVRSLPNTSDEDEDVPYQNRLLQEKVASLQSLVDSLRNQVATLQDELNILKGR